MSRRDLTKTWEGYVSFFFFFFKLSVCVSFFPLRPFPSVEQFPKPNNPFIRSSLSTAFHRALASCTFNGSPPLAWEELFRVSVMFAQWWMDKKTKNPSSAFLVLQWELRVKGKGFQHAFVITVYLTAISMTFIQNCGQTTDDSAQWLSGRFLQK